MTLVVDMKHRLYPEDGSGKRCRGADPSPAAEIDEVVDGEPVADVEADSLGICL